jgi:hypothetical protein
VSDTKAAAQAAVLTFAISFGEGDKASSTSKAPLIINHVYTKTGSFTVGVTATDEFGHASSAATVGITVVAAAIETDPFNANQTALFVGGTTGNDTATFAASGSNGIAVRLRAYWKGLSARAGQ